jgi:hypothetical protein
MSLAWDCTNPLGLDPFPVESTVGEELQMSWMDVMARLVLWRRIG